jgi:ABC-type cobalt transport system substrate-binding protein
MFDHLNFATGIVRPVVWIKISVCRQTGIWKVTCVMNRGVRWQLVLALTVLAGSLLFAADKRAATWNRAENNRSEIELRGKLVPFETPVTHVVFKTESGEIYTLISNRLSCALFLDTNLQVKTLLLGGRVLPATRTFEVTHNLRSIREGKVHELYYYCDICSISGSESGPCMCCREPVRLVEEPATNPKIQIPSTK